MKVILQNTTLVFRGVQYEKIVVNTLLVNNIVNNKYITPTGLVGDATPPPIKNVLGSMQVEKDVEYVIYTPNKSYIGGLGGYLYSSDGGSSPNYYHYLGYQTFGTWEEATDDNDNTIYCRPVTPSADGYLCLGGFYGTDSTQDLLDRHIMFGKKSDIQRYGYKYAAPLAEVDVPMIEETNVSE